MINIFIGRGGACSSRKIGIKHSGGETPPLRFCVFLHIFTTLGCHFCANLRLFKKMSKIIQKGLQKAKNML
jgi:hypothetical protein